jgi:signal transduction histidine kinase
LDLVTILWSVCAAIAIVLAAICGLLWFLERRAVVLTLCVLAIAAAASAYFELGMLRSASAAEYTGWLHWYYLSTFVFLVGQLLFVHYYLGTGRVWLLWVIVVARVLVVALNLSNVRLFDIVSLSHVSLLGEQVSTLGVVSPRFWQAIALISTILLVVYVVDASAREWRKGGKESRRKALAVGVGMAVPLLCTITYTQLLVFGVVQGVVSNVPWFLGVLLVMAYELGRDFIVSKRARVEVAELRAQMAHDQRVSVMGQLASALSHELGQPLTGALLNAESAQMQLKAKSPDLRELRAVVQDIGADCRRASDIIHRMREFLRRRAMDMRRIELAEIIEDAVALARSEATYRNVAVTVRMQPELPHIVGDRVHLTQVMLNLLMNGIEAMESRPNDVKRIVVEAHANDANTEVEVAVHDFGPGIPHGKDEEVFQPFFTTKEMGLGVGLALSRTIVEAHGGRLWADRAQDGGAVFRFTLQRA